MLATELLSQTTLRFVLLGAATGSLTGLVGLGIILVYRASGVLNFAAGALGGLGAFVCYWLRDDRGLPTGLAVLGGLLVGALLGALTALVMAYIRHASLLTKLIATLALLSAAQGLMIVVWGAEITQPTSFLPTDQVTLFGDVKIGQDRLVLIGLVVVLAVGLRLVYSRTLFGLATSAVAENRAVAAAAGWSTGTIELVNFTVGGLLSAFAAIMLAPIVTLTAAVMSISVIGALAAALVGRFSSFGVTVAAAMFIGVVQSELSLFQPDIADAAGVGVNSLTGLPQAVPLLIILGFIVASGRGRLERGETLARLPLPGTGQVSLIPLAAGVVLGGVLLVQVESWAEALITTFGLGILVCSVVVVSGYAGQLSLCQYALGGFGAWVASKMFVVHGLPFEVAVLIGMGVALAAGVVVALPALRTRGVNLAVATLAMALLFNAIVFTNSALTGGVRGTVVESLTVFGVDVDPISHPQRYGLMALVSVVVTGLVVANVRRGRIGRRMLAVRSNERAAAALGINVAGVKLYAFALGAAIAALGGVVIAFRQQNIQFQMFDVFGSILLVQYAVIGGLGWVSGAVAGAAPAPGGVMARIVNDGFPDLGNVGYYLAIFAAFGVVSIIRKTPDGIAAMWGRGALSRRLAPFRFPSDTSETPDTSAMSGTSEAAHEPAEGDERLAPLPLEVRGITVRFGGVVAVRDVSFDVQPGEIVGLIGPNGAGKTTLLDVITGFTSPQEGSIRLGGRDMSGRSPEQRARAGMSRSWQAVELFEEMTVRDNLLVACDDLDRRRYLTDLVRPGRQSLSPLARRIVDELGLSGALDRRPSSLPQGHTRLVGIARAVVGRTSVLLLDEPAAGLSTDESTELAAIVRTIATTYGVGVLIVEHDVPLLLSVCDRIVALDFGEKIAEGTPAEISANANVISSYLGVEEVAHDELQLSEAT